MSASRPGAQRRRSSLVRAGLDPDRAFDELARAGLMAPDSADPVADVDDLLAVVSETADPQDAFTSLVRLAENLPDVFTQVRDDPDWLRRVAAVAGASRPLGDLLSRFEDAVGGLESLDPVFADDVAEDVERALTEQASDDDGGASAVASIRRRSTADIAARDLTGEIPVEDVAAELSALAEGVLRGALAALHRRVAPARPAARIAVIGMGKLGGVELNYVSDVDVVFVHAPTGDDEHAAATEATRVLEELLRILNASTTMGRAYEVDPTLRPEGRAGPLSRTVESFVAYWDRWAETWEFQALLKARPVAGDLELGGQLLSRAERYVYPHELDPGIVAEVRRMKQRVESKPEVVRHGDRQLKLGPGGLRDIEFTVQLLQLVHGRADPSLRHTGTLPTLSALAEGGYVAEEDATAFAAAYRTLRSVEHRLQLAAERRTHTIPDDEEKQERLARSLGYRPVGDEPARVGFLAELRRLQGEVRDLHTKLFFRPLLETHAAITPTDVDLARPRGMDDDAARERLAALGFRDSGRALGDVRALTAGVSRAARTLGVVLPAFLNEVQEMPDPDAGLRRFRDLAESQAANATFLGRLRDHPPTVTGLARVFGTSEVAAELVASQPQELASFDEDALRAAPPDRDELVGLALARLAWQEPMAALRRLKRQWLLRIVLRDLLADATAGRIGAELTVLAEALLEAGLRSVLTDLALEGGGTRPDDLPLRMAVIGMGKLGGHELHYVSDLDVMFVHRPVAGSDRSRAHELANEAAERLMRSLGAVTAEGTAFEVDADLRPEGRNGPLSRSLESYEAYYERWSEPWEHQALLRARPVAGDVDLGRAFLDVVRPLAYPEEPSAVDVQRIRTMKARIEKERIRRRDDPKRHLKLGPGGLSDIEWTVQLLQHLHGHAEPRIQTPATMEALDAAQDAALIEHRDATWLRDGYHFLTRVRNRLYLLRFRNVDVLPGRGADLTRLAHSLGYGLTGRQAFEEDHLRLVRHVRRVAERVFFAIPEE